MSENKEGPYKIEIWEADEFVVTGPGWDTVSQTYRKREAVEIVRYANAAYASGRASRDEEVAELKAKIAERVRP